LRKKQLLEIERKRSARPKELASASA